MEKYFKVGQKVWNLYGNEGEVVGIDDGSQHPLNVSFNDMLSISRFTYDGRHNVKSPIVLFQTAPIITPNVPIIEFEKGELVWVRISGERSQWYALFFSHLEEDLYACFLSQKKKGDTQLWSQIRKLTDNPLLTL